MIEISVVLPQPDGPTSSVIAPGMTSRSMPRKACTRVSPLPKVLVNPRQRMAGSGPYGPLGGAAKACAGGDLPARCARCELHHAPRKTMAGSRNNTRRMLSRLASDTMTSTATPTPATACQCMYKPARCVI